ncbi:hypothetical protein EPUL_005635, partial [Erysiphe pulchra]
MSPRCTGPGRSDTEEDEGCGGWQQEGPREARSPADIRHGERGHQEPEGARRFLPAGDQEVHRGQLQGGRREAGAVHPQVPQGSRRVRRTHPPKGKGAWQRGRQEARQEGAGQAERREEAESGRRQEDCCSEEARRGEKGRQAQVTEQGEEGRQAADQEAQVAETEESGREEAQDPEEERRQEE